MGRKRKIDQIEPSVTPTPPEVYSGIPVLAPEEAAAPITESLFDDEPTEDDIVPILSVVPEVDEGLTEDERKAFIELVKKFSTPEARAKQLAKLAMFSDTKRAPVALRAIQEINAITGVSGTGATESAPMFALPKDTQVNVQITKVVKSE